MCRAKLTIFLFLLICNFAYGVETRAQSSKQDQSEQISEYSNQMKAKMVLWNEKFSATKTQELFKEEYKALNVPSHNSILSWREKFLKTGSVFDEYKGTLKTVRTDETEQKVLGKLNTIFPIFS